MAIRSLLAERVPAAPASDSLADRATYARDSWQRGLIELSDGGMPNGGRMPAAVVWPTSTEDVVRLVELGRSEGLKLVPFGAGSGVCGGIAGDERTVVVDLKRLAQWRVQDGRQVLSVGPGATGISLETKLQQQGLTVGHFPSSIICSTVGGWVAGRGAGQCSSRYGKIEDMLLRAECVLGSGRIVTLQRRETGFNLLPLMIGSEGALGFITNLELRVNELPRKRRYAAFHLKNGRAGMAAMRQLMQANVRPTVMRLYDALDTLLMERSSGERHETAHAPNEGVFARARKRAVRELLSMAPLVNRGVDALERSPFGRWVLLLIFEGEDADPELERATRIVQQQGGASAGEAPARRWYEHRYAISWNQIPVFRSGAFNDTLEVAAPWSRLEELERSVRRALGRHVIVLEHMSHAYPDGCSIYFTVVGGRRSRESALSAYDSAWREALDAARSAGGAISHHHGIGRSKAAALEQDLGGASHLLRRVLRSWDPDGIMNPGVILPLEATRDSLAAPSYPAVGIDELSQLVTAEATSSVTEVEGSLRSRGYTLGFESTPEVAVGEWLARGFPGAHGSFDDPADHVVAGIAADSHADEALVLAPVPRRATGPDLTALVVGAEGRFARLRRTTLRIRRSDVPALKALPFSGERDPSPNDGELAALEELVTGVTKS